MTQNVIHTLDAIIRQEARQMRSTELLREPSADSTDGWYMCVPSCFNSALDIKQTERKKAIVWTQGSAFAFTRGDTLYDTAEAYKVWSAAMKKISLCIQVKDATSSGFAEAKSARFPGSVTFSILVPSKDRTKIVERGDHTMSQDDFVRFLIVGPSRELKKKIKKFQPSK